MVVLFFSQLFSFFDAYKVNTSNDNIISSFLLIDLTNI